MGVFYPLYVTTNHCPNDTKTLIKFVNGHVDARKINITRREVFTISGISGQLQARIIFSLPFLPSVFYSKDIVKSFLFPQFLSFFCLFL
jgi:hypothetical protein